MPSQAIWLAALEDAFVFRRASPAHTHPAGFLFGAGVGKQSTRVYDTAPPVRGWC